MAMSAREMLANLPIRMAKGGSISEKQKQRILAAEEKFLANPEKFTGAQLYNKMLEAGVSVQDMLDAGVKQSTIDQVFTAQEPIPVEQFTGPTTAKSSLAGLEAQEREAAIARGTALVNKLQQGGIDPEERRRLQRAATQYGVTFQDMMNAGIDPSILFDVQTATTPKGPVGSGPEVYDPNAGGPGGGTVYKPDTGGQTPVDVYKPDTGGQPGPTVYQPGAVNPVTPGLDTAFRESPVRERIPGTEEFDRLTGSPTGYRYTPAARLTPATGSGLSWTPPVVTSRPRQLLDVGGGYMPSYSQRYAAGRSQQDQALMEAFDKSGRKMNYADYNYWRNRLRANQYGGVQDIALNKEKFLEDFNAWNAANPYKPAGGTPDGGTPDGGTPPPAGGTTNGNNANGNQGGNQTNDEFIAATGDPLTDRNIQMLTMAMRPGGAMMFAGGGPVKKPEGVVEESATPETESRNMLDRLVGIGEAGLTAGTAMASSVPAGLKGIYDFAATPGSFYDRLKKATETIEGQTMATTYLPRTEAGKEYLGNLAMLAAPSEYVGEKTFEMTGSPYMATAAEIGGDPLNFVPGVSGLKTAAAAVAGVSKAAKSGSKAAKMLDDFDQISTKAKSQVEPRRRTKAGQYIGAPEGVDTPQKLASIVKSMKNLAKEGEYGRFWYERSGRQILDLVGGDVDAADKIIQAIAITSPQTPVANNFEYALQAYNQWKNGEPIKTGTYTGAMSKKLQAMFDAAPDQDVHGVKTGNFYKNLMVEIDPSRVQGATIDLWMMRAFGYKGDAPTAAQYRFAENEVKRIANELGWEPQQVQAAVWVDLKSRMENPDLKKAVETESVANGWMHYEKVNGKNVRVLDDPERHRALWLERSLAYSPTAEDMTRAKFDYADAAEKNLAQVSWESIPGRKTTHMPEIFDAPYEVINDYHVAMSKAFLDDQGGDIIARRLGMMSPGDFEAPGYFEGRVSPGTQTEIVAPRQFGITAREKAIRAQAKEEGWSKEKLAREIGKVQAASEPAAMDQIAVYAAVRGILMKQDGVGYHRPQYVAGLSAPRANGVQINIGRPLTPNETSAFAEALSKYAGHGEYNPIGDPAGVRIINFDYLEVPNTDFQDIVNKALGDIELEGGESINARRFTADTGYSGNNWKEKVNGEGYLDDSRLAGRPDLQQVVRDIVTELAPRIEAVETEFANKYGWTRNPELNSAYLKGEEVTSTMPDSGGTR